MNFDDLYQLATDAQRTRHFILDIGTIATAAIEPFRRLLDSQTLSLQGVTVKLSGKDEIVIYGSLQIAIRIDCELRFFREANGIGYTLSFATRKPLALLKGDLSRLAALVDIDALWWTASSRAVDLAAIAIPGLEAKAVRLREGFDNFNLRLISPVLTGLHLADAIFDVAMSGDVPVFSTARRLDIALPPILRAHFSRIGIATDGTVAIEGEVQFRLLGSDLPALNLQLAFKPQRVAMRLPVPRALEMPRDMPFQAITLHDNHVDIDGQLGSTSYAVGLDGTFALHGSGHGGAYRLKYDAANTTPVPDMIELSIDTFTPSDAVKLVSPFAIKLPDGLDRLVTLRNGYIYYAAGPGAQSSDGTPLEQGSSARASVTIFGQAAYFAADVRQAGAHVALLTNPLRLGNILALRGSGVSPPRQYRGPAFAPDAIGIDIDTIAGSARTVLQVDFLGKPVERVQAQFEQGALSLKTQTSLDNIANMSLQIAADAQGITLKGGFDLSADVDVPIRYGFNLRGLGKISGVLGFDQPLNGQATSTVTATLKILGLGVHTTFAIDAADIKDLADLTYRALYAEARKLFTDAVELMKAVLAGAVKYTLDAAEAGARLVTYLVKDFNATGEGIISIMKHAGATAEQALDLVRAGAVALGEFAYGKVVEALRTLFSPEEAMGAMRHWAAQFGGEAAELAQNIAWLLNEGGYGATAIAQEAWRCVEKLENKLEAFVTSLSWANFKAAEVALQLQLRSVGVDVTGKILGPIFGTDILEAALSPAYGAEQAARVAGNIMRETSRFSRNVEHEVRRTVCHRLGVCW